MNKSNDEPSELAKKKLRAAVFWDAENVALRNDHNVARKFRTWLDNNYTTDALFAFADWNGPYRDLGRLLYKIGFDLIHVPDDLKDSADCQMASYIVDWIIRSPDTEFYVIASGDAVFEPMTQALQKQGKRVMVVSNPMITRPETVLRADIYKDIATFRDTPARIEEVGGEKDVKMSPEEAKSVAFRRLQEAIAKLNRLGKSTPREYVIAVVDHLNPGLNIGHEGFDSWSQIINQAIAEGYITLEGDEPYPELVLSGKTAKISQDSSLDIDNTMMQFQKVVEEMYHSGEHMGMESVVHKVREKGIDYSKLGYSRFGNFARAAESRDIIRIIDQHGSPPLLKPVYSFEQVLEWYKQNTRKFFGTGAKVPSNPFIERTIRMLYKYDTGIPEMESYLERKDIKDTYNAILRQSGLSFIPPYEQIILAILLGKDWNCEDAINVVNQELAPLGYAIECP